MNKGSVIACLVVLVLVLIPLSCTQAPAAPTATAAPAATPLPKVNLPSSISIVAYDVGSAGYSQAAALSNAITTKYGTTIRIVPAGTGLARIIALSSGRARYGFLGDEGQYAADGTYDFAEYTQGPQDMRVLLQHPSVGAMYTAADLGIKTIADLKGKRIPYVPGSPTFYVKIEAVLLFANLTWKDVTRVDFPSLQASLEGLQQNRVDIGFALPTNSACYQLEASRGIVWLQMPPEDKEGWARVNSMWPAASAGQEDRGAGLVKGKPVWLPFYGFPQMYTFASTPASEVYDMMKAIDETKDLWVNVDPVMPDWAFEKAGKSPAGAPFHEGAVKYLKEKGIWTQQDDQWNNQGLARMKRIQDAWKSTIEAASAQKIAEKNFPKFWLERQAAAAAAK